jgi:hypothetical protein
MKNEILDDIESEKIENRKPVNQIILISIGTIILYFLIELFRDSVPENLFERNGVQIKTIGLIIIGIVILNSILIPTFLNRIKPVFNYIKVIVWTGLIIFAIEIAFKLLQNLLLTDNGLNLDYLQLIKSAGIISGIGVLIANIRIHKLRGKKTLIPILIFIGIWITVGLILKK